MEVEIDLEIIIPRNRKPLHTTFYLMELDTVVP